MRISPLGNFYFSMHFFQPKKNAHTWNCFAMHGMFPQISSCLHPLIDAGPTVWASSISILECSIADRQTDGRNVAPHTPLALPGRDFLPSRERKVGSCRLNVEQSSHQKTTWTSAFFKFRNWQTSSSFRFFPSYDSGNSKNQLIFLFFPLHFITTENIKKGCLVASRD